MTKLRMIAGLLCLAIMITACSEEVPNKWSHDGLPDRCPESRVVGSSGFLGSFSMGGDTLEEMVTHTDRVVVGIVESYEIDESYVIFNGETSPDPDHLIVSTVYKVRVLETLHTLSGEHKDYVTVWFLGGLDYGTTKPCIGEKLVLLLLEAYDGEYTTIRFEEGVFSVNRNGTLYSFSDSGAAFEFDGKSLLFLERELEKAVDEVLEEALEIREGMNRIRREGERERDRERQRERNNGGNNQSGRGR